MPTKSSNYSAIGEYCLAPKTLLSYVLSRLERLEVPLLRHREIEAYPARDIRALMRQGMLVIAPDAETVLLGSGPCQGRLVAVRKSSNGWDGIDEEDAFFSSVPLLEEDVRQYTINVPVIVDML